MKNRSGALLIIIAAVLWGTAGFFVRTLQGLGINPMQTVFLRALFSVVILAVFTVFTNRSAFAVKLRDLPLFASSGIFSIVMFNFCYYKTMSLSTLSVAAVLLYTAPFFVMLLSVPLFKERLTLKKCLSAVCAFIGCCFVSGLFGSELSISGKGLFYGLLTGFGYSLYTVFGNILLKRGYSSVTVTFYTFLFAAGACVLFTDLPGTFSLLTGSARVPVTALGMAFFNTVLPYLCYTSGLKSVPPDKAPVIATVEPVTATVLGIMLYSEPLTLHGLIGILLVLGSVIILNSRLGEKNENKGEC